MTTQTENLTVGDRAPDFTLGAADHDRRYLLSELISRGPVIVEFLRGTW